MTPGYDPNSGSQIGKPETARHGMPFALSQLKGSKMAQANKAGKNNAANNDGASNETGSAVTSANDGKQIRKITVKAVCGAMDLKKIMNEEKIPLCDIFGIAQRTKVVSGDYGESVRFVGQFRAINLDTGELFKSTRLYLPKALEEELHSAMESVKATGAAVNAEFGLRISVLFDNNVAVKYYFDAENIIQPQSNDALENLMGRVMETRKTLALAAPAKE